jgi:hypothetical protein
LAGHTYLGFEGCNVVIEIDVIDIFLAITDDVFFQTYDGIMESDAG